MKNYKKRVEIWKWVAIGAGIGLFILTVLLVITAFVFDSALSETSPSVIKAVYVVGGYGGTGLFLMLIIVGVVLNSLNEMREREEESTQILKHIRHLGQ